MMRHAAVPVQCGTGMQRQMMPMMRACGTVTLQLSVEPDDAQDSLPRLSMICGLANGRGTLRRGARLCPYCTTCAHGRAVQVSAVQTDIPEPQTANHPGKTLTRTGVGPAPAPSPLPRCREGPADAIPTPTPKHAQCPAPYRPLRARRVLIHDARPMPFTGAPQTRHIVENGRKTRALPRGPGAARYTL